MRIQWDQDGTRYFETGVANGVVYIKSSSGSYGKGFPWNGLTSVEESPEGGDDNDFCADDIKYLSLKSREEYKASIGAYTYPEKFKECDGSKEMAPGVYIGQQTRSRFGFCFKTRIGNDILSEDYGYKLHIVYNCQVNPSSRSYQTMNESPEAIEFSWDLSTISEKIEGYKACAAITIDSTKADPDKLKELEDKLYGTETTDPMLPSMSEVFDLMKTKTVQSFAQATPPTKTNYTLNETFDAEGFSGTVTYSDSSIETVQYNDSRVVYSPTTLDSTAITTVTATFTDLATSATCDISVTVTE